MPITSYEATLPGGNPPGQICGITIYTDVDCKGNTLTTGFDPNGRIECQQAVSQGAEFPVEAGAKSAMFGCLERA